MNNISDIDLIRQSKNGNKNAMEHLILRHQKAVYNVAYRLVGNSVDASDITQQAFFKMIVNIQQYDNNYKFFSWIYRITINEAISFLRKKNTQQLNTEQLESTNLGPADSLAQEEVQVKVQQALMKLKDEYRSVIVLKHFVGRNYQEISDILQIPIKIVKSRLYTARQQMREILYNTGVND